MSKIDRVLRSNLKLRHLQLLIALDEFRHLGRVSEFLSLTQPAVSKTLAEIERTFGLRLFLRSTKGTEPTPNGRAVVQFALSVLADFARTRDELAAIDSGAAGRTSLGAMVVAMTGLVSGAVELLKRASSQTVVSIEEGDLTRLLPRLRVGELDLVVGRLEPGYAAPDLEMEPLYQEGMCLIVRPKHPLAGQSRAAWKDLVDFPWVMPPPWASSRIKLNQLFYRHQLEPPANLIESASFLVTLNFVRDHGAIGFVARSVGAHLKRERLARVLHLPVPMELPPVGLIRIRSRIPTHATQQMITCLRTVAAANKPAKRGTGHARATVTRR